MVGFARQEVLWVAQGESVSSLTKCLWIVVDTQDKLVALQLSVQLPLQKLVDGDADERPTRKTKWGAS